MLLKQRVECSFRLWRKGRKRLGAAEVNQGACEKHQEIQQFLRKAGSEEPEGRSRQSGDHFLGAFFTAEGLGVRGLDLAGGLGSGGLRTTVGGVGEREFPVS